jgi:tetratricopeptide (TPR) repeat protein
VGEDIREIYITLDHDTWRLEIPFRGRWAHWAMNDPPCIVVDLIGATSRLPNAPGIYELDLPNGPVKTLRTSQYSSDLGNRRMRISLVLTEPVRYEVGKCDGGIDIRVPRPERAVWGDLWELDLGSEGVNRQVVKSIAPPPQCESETFDTAAPSAKGPAASGTVQSAAPQNTPPPVVKDAQPATSAGTPVAGKFWRPAPGAIEDGGLQEFEFTLESILADTSFFEMDAPTADRSREIAWSTAAGRLVEEAQKSFLEGDTAACIERLRTCDHFYPNTTPGRQAALLRHLLLRSWGRVVEADLGPLPPREGHWPLLLDPVFERMHGEALRNHDLWLSADVLRYWKQADPDTARWAQAALRQAEAHLDAEEGERAAQWVQAAMAADPDLQTSPRALLSHGLALAIQDRGDEAEGILRTVEASGDSTVVPRAQAARADIYYRQRRYQDAADLYRQLARWEVPPLEREWALYQLGNCWSLLGDPTKARAYYTVAIETAPNGFWTQFAQMRLAELEAEGRGTTR